VSRNAAGEIYERGEEERKGDLRGMQSRRRQQAEPAEVLPGAGGGSSGKKKKRG